MSAVDRSVTMVIGRERLNVAVARAIPERAKDEKADLRASFGSGYTSNDHTNRRRVVYVERVGHLRAVRKDGEHVTLGTQVDVMSWPRIPSDDAGFADVIDGHAHEKVDVAYDVALIEVELRQDRGEIVVAGLCGLDAIAQLIVGSAAASVNRIVAAEGVRDHSEKRISRICVEDSSVADVNVALHLYRVHR